MHYYAEDHQVNEHGKKVLQSSLVQLNVYSPSFSEFHSAKDDIDALAAEIEGAGAGKEQNKSKSKKKKVKKEYE